MSSTSPVPPPRVLGGSYAELLEGDREDAIAAVCKRLEWFGQDCITTARRIEESPRFAIALIMNLSSMMQEIDRMGGVVQARQAVERDTNAWGAAQLEGQEQKQAAD
jgi:hypothetical protein